MSLSRGLRDRLLAAIMAAQALTDFDKLRLNILDVDDFELRPDGRIQEIVCLVPRPQGRRDGLARGKLRCGDVSLMCIWLDEMV